MTWYKILVDKEVKAAALAALKGGIVTRVETETKREKKDKKKKNSQCRLVVAKLYTDADRGMNRQRCGRRWCSPPCTSSLPDEHSSELLDIYD